MDLPTDSPTYVDTPKRSILAQSNLQLTRVQNRDPPIDCVTNPLAAFQVEYVKHSSRSEEFMNVYGCPICNSDWYVRVIAL